MTRKPVKLLGGAAAICACALGGVALASGAATSTRDTTTTIGTGPAGATTAPGTPATTRTSEAPLTGDVLAKVTAAAEAKTGGKVDVATTETDSDNAAAVYEAHVTKTDGTHVTVILDKDYNVLAVETGGPGGGRHGHGGPGHGGPGGPANGETPLTGDTATKPNAAAVAKTGGTADLATTETDSSNSAAVYEVHVTKTDGTHVTVILDKDFNALTVETQPQHGPHGPGRP
jgi:uncharacterized membrane protein YkoI